MSQYSITLEDLQIPNLGEKKFPSPGWQRNFSPEGTGWHTDGDRILLCDHIKELAASLADNIPLPSIELAGPRKEIFFNPPETSVAIVTCGGLCPGLNDVIRTIVMQSYYAYGVRRILGIPYGYEGLDPAYGHRPVELTPEMVVSLGYFGGTFLGSSRGRKGTGVMVDRLENLGVDILFVIGGDGSQRGAFDLHEECRKRENGISIVGVPKTIDNDLMFMDRSFGYQSAFAAACHVVTGAHAEARGARNGIGLVKLMGRDSGFIACSAALATGEVNFVLIPEVDFELEGEQGLLSSIERRLEQRGHAVVVVAEGAGQDLIPESEVRRDASGNRLHEDIGVFLRDRINAYFKIREKDLTLKYIDPSYTIRSVPAAPEDRVFCLNLARHAVHAGMAGKTGMVVARWHQRFVHLPMSIVTQGRQKVDPHGDFWRSVVEATGQPSMLKR